MTPAATLNYRPPYRSFITPAFDRSRHNAHYRNLLRWSYRAFREQKHSTPFSARAQIANMTMRLDRIA